MNNLKPAMDAETNQAAVRRVKPPISPFADQIRLDFHTQTGMVLPARVCANCWLNVCVLQGNTIPASVVLNSEHECSHRLRPDMVLYHAMKRMPMEPFWETSDPWGAPEGPNTSVEIPAQPRSGLDLVLPRLRETIRELGNRRDTESEDMEDFETDEEIDASYARFETVEEELVAACWAVLGAVCLSEDEASAALDALMPAITVTAR
ncbi:hypothetical protein [Arthrobacter sp. 162MFSha1.1]|uniref:hypothetical protein n=1 Tax=Arthrobacter sp. 162MFSha1.1 TaxID=1151119 RepID=UPI00037F0A0B|nr:hypothetical protein [Arthrobacter sp. 162MFSha1.1]